MEVKKSPKADLEGKKSTWMLIGYVLILAAVFVAFEWTERDKQVTTDTGVVEPIFEEEMIPITEEPEQKQAPPPPEAPKVEEVIQIAENDADVEETTIKSSEDDNTAVEIKYIEPVVEEEEPVEEEIFMVVEHIVDPVVMRSVDPYLDKEALRVISTMPKWKPGMQRGKAVRVKYTVPVTFRLQ